MKKSLLLAGVLSSVLSFGQSISDRQNSGSQYFTKDLGRAIDLPSIASEQGKTMSVNRSGMLNKYRGDVYSFVQIGTSFYDLQTNASVGRRLLLNPDGTITTAWTYSPDASANWPSRGTAINDFDGTDWGAFPNARIENTRTGWPSIGVLGDGSTYTLGHISSDGGLVMATRPSGGSTWTSSTPKLQYSGGVPIWNRSGSNGDTLHVLMNFWGDGGAAPDAVIGKITNPTVYSRSFDGGKTWVDKHIFLPGYDSNYYESGSGDAYAIDVKGSTVAIAIGGVAKDLSLWKSEDNGDTWVKSVPMAFPVPAYKWGKALLPQDSNYMTNDGSMDLLIDNNGVCHIVSGMLGVYDEDTTDDGIFLPNFFSVWHWSETFPTWKVSGTPIDMDLANDPETNQPWSFAPETSSSLGTDGQPPAGRSYAARYGRTSLSTHPSMSVDKDNNIFLTYDCPVELILHDFGANLRDINVTYSGDGGETWSDAQNATQWRTMEVVFGSQSRIADDYIHFVFQADEYPGTHLQNNGNTGLHPNDENGIFYAAIPTSDIIDGKLGDHNLSAKPIEQDAKLFVVSQNYPNPFNDVTNVTVYLRAGSDVKLNVTDILGQKVIEKNLGFLGAGNHAIEIDASALKSGIYFYSLQTKDHEVTRRMKVVH
jgi:hypothetical protein